MINALHFLNFIWLFEEVAVQCIQELQSAHEKEPCLQEIHAISTFLLNSINLNNHWNALEVLRNYLCAHFDSYEKWTKDKHTSHLWNMTSIALRWFTLLYFGPVDYCRLHFLFAQHTFDLLLTLFSLSVEKHQFN